MRQTRNSGGLQPGLGDLIEHVIPDSTSRVQLHVFLSHCHRMKKALRMKDAFICVIS